MALVVAVVVVVVLVVLLVVVLVLEEYLHPAVTNSTHIYIYFF